jgi:acyl-CoA synthetase (AMP-forming)/AMP-acid ligase II
MISELCRHSLCQPALIDSGAATVLTYEELLSLIEADRQTLAHAPHPALAMLWCENTVESIVAYLGCLAAGTPVCLVEPSAKALAALVQRYQPSLLLLPADVAPPVGYERSGLLAAGGYGLCVHPGRTPYRPGLHPALALLLPTSGSTGSSKLVRLSLDNLTANAKSIASYLQLGPHERSVQSLPLHYAYGLSLVNSHLYAGGTVVVNPHSFMDLDFWNVFDGTRCTSFAGVPYMYELLRRLNLNPAVRPTLRTLTQAGGKLRPELIEWYRRSATRQGKRFYVMYGQTEATARIAYVPPRRLREKIGSVGVPVPGGDLRLEPVDGMPGANQLVYAGPNVMLGYADRPQDLLLGDVQHGVLATADLGRRDAEGYFYLTGRLRRMAKLFGKRIHLGDVEEEVERSFPCRAVASDRGNKLGLLIEAYGALQLAAVRRHVARFLSVRPHAVGVELIHQIPMTASGKKDYHALDDGTVAG